MAVRIRLMMTRLMGFWVKEDIFILPFYIQMGLVYHDFGIFAMEKGHPSGCPYDSVQEIMCFQPSQSIDAIIVNRDVESFVIAEFIHIIDVQEEVLLEVLAVFIGADVVLRILDHGTAVAISQDGFQKTGNVQIAIHIDEGAVGVELVGGIRSGMGYCGANTIALLQKAKFVRITSNGVVENHPHDITITRETPNYTRGE